MKHRTLKIEAINLRAVKNRLNARAKTTVQHRTTQVS
jgi:hypothetical protein